MQTMSPAAERAIQAARGKFVVEPALAGVQGEDRQTAEAIIRQSLATSVRVAMALAAGLALAGAATAAFTIRSGSDRSADG